MKELEEILLKEISSDKILYRRAEVLELMKKAYNLAIDKCIENARITGTWGRDDYNSRGISTRDEDGSWIDLEINKEGLEKLKL